MYRIEDNLPRICKSECEKARVGEVFEVSNDLWVIGEYPKIFAAYRDRIYKMDEYGKFLVNFTIDNPTEMEWFNALQKYVMDKGTEFHTSILLDQDHPDYEKESGVIFNETVGWSAGTDPDSELKEELRLRIDIEKLEHRGSIDPKGYKNSNGFCYCLDIQDDRRDTYKLQRLERGFDDTETWNLDSTIAKFIAPRLKRFKEVSRDYPMDIEFDTWQGMLDKMIWSFEHYDYEDEEFGGVEFYYLPEEKKNELHKQYREGIELFCKRFDALWW